MTHNQCSLYQSEMFIRSFAYLENCLEKLVLLSSPKWKDSPAFNSQNLKGNTGDHITGGVNFTVLQLFSAPST